jgi:hypothetical protein
MAIVAQFSQGDAPIQSIFGIDQSKPTMVKKIIGTMIQWISLLVLFWWLTPYSSNHCCTVLD